MSRIIDLLSGLKLRRVSRRCRANAWASVYADLYDLEPETDGGDE